MWQLCSFRRYICQGQPGTLFRCSSHVLLQCAEQVKVTTGSYYTFLCYRQILIQVRGWWWRYRKTTESVLCSGQLGWLWPRLSWLIRLPSHHRFPSAGITSGSHHWCSHLGSFANLWTSWRSFTICKIKSMRIFRHRGNDSSRLWKILQEPWSRNPSTFCKILQVFRFIIHVFCKFLQSLLKHFASFFWKTSKISGPEKIKLLGENLRTHQLNLIKHHVHLFSA